MPNKQGKRDCADLMVLYFVTTTKFQHYFGERTKGKTLPQILLRGWSKQWRENMPLEPLFFPSLFQSCTMTILGKNFAGDQCIYNILQNICIYKERTMISLDRISKCTDRIQCINLLYSCTRSYLGWNNLGNLCINTLIAYINILASMQNCQIQQRDKCDDLYKFYVAKACKIAYLILYDLWYSHVNFIY